jgi:hypothetical protein
MKNHYSFLILLFLSLSIYAQSPEKMSYQAVVRDANNTLVANQTVGMQISILQSSITGIVVYTETHSVDANSNGLVSLEIGTGSSTSGNFSLIDWSAGPYFIKTETDPTGGTSYTINGTSQLMSVPFALYAKSSGSSLPGPEGPQGPQGPGGSNNGAVGVSFSMELTGSPTQWSNNAPPQNVSVDQIGPYILYTGEDSTNNNIMPLLAKNFEFIHLEGNSWAGAPTPSPGDFPIIDHIQQNNVFTTPLNGHKLPQLGPQPTGQTSYNNFYGFRVPQDGQMVGFQINYIQKPMTGQFYAMYYNPNSGQPRVIFNKGGPLVGNMNSSGPISMAYASGNTLWDDSVTIPVKADGFIFVMSDLSFRAPNGVYSSNWNSQIGPGPTIPFRAPSGKIHATVYLTYD